MDVFVVGILNWVFDLVKMNRVIYFLRLEMSENELFEIVLLIIEFLMGDFFIMLDKVEEMFLKIKFFVGIYWRYNGN